MQAGHPQVGPAEVGAAEVGRAQVGVAQIGLSEVGAAEVGLVQVGATEVRPEQVGRLTGSGSGLSWIMDRSNSAKTPSIWNMARPLGVVVSMACWWRKRSTRFRKARLGCSRGIMQVLAIELVGNKQTFHHPISTNFRFAAVSPCT